MGPGVRADDKSESGRDGDTAYEAVMCWEWEGGALAPTQAARPANPWAAVADADRHHEANSYANASSASPSNSG